MSVNIIDITNILTLLHFQTTKEKEQESSQNYRKFSKSRNSLSTSSIHPQNKKLPISTSIEKLQQTTQKISKVSKKKLLFEILDNRIITIYRSSSANCYNFDHIHEIGNRSQFQILADWIVGIDGIDEHSIQKDKSKSTTKKIEIVHFAIKITCKILLLHKYSNYEFFELLLIIGKKFIGEGIYFQVNLQFQAINTQDTQKTFRQNFTETSYRNKSKLKRQIKYLSDLKELIQQIKQKPQMLKYIWLLCQNFHLGIAFISNYNFNKPITVFIENLLSQSKSIFYQNEFSINKYQDINVKICLSTLCQIPQQFNLGKTRRVLQEAIQLKNNLSLMINQQQPFFSFRERNFSENNQDFQFTNYKLNDLASAQQCSRVLRQNSNLPKKAKLESQKVSKNSKPETYQRKKGKKVPLLKQQHQNSHLLLSSFQSSPQQKNICQAFPEPILNSNYIPNTNVASLLAQNMHLKWQLKSIHKDYQIQSQKFIQKTDKKYKDIVEQRSFCLQQNARLRKDNQQLLKEVNALKLDYQDVIKTRGEYERSLIDIGRNNQQIIQSKYKDKISELQDQLRVVQYQNKNLQKNLQNSKTHMQDVRKRNKEKISQLNEQMETYKKFSQEIKFAFDDLEAQSRLDRDRCQNLQKRCKKYQQTLSDLMKLKSNASSQFFKSNYGSVQSCNDPFCKAFQIMNQQKQSQQGIKQSIQISNTQRRSRRNSLKQKQKQKQKSNKFQQLNSQLQSKLKLKKQSKQVQTQKIKLKKGNQQKLQYIRSLQLTFNK